MWDADDLTCNGKLADLKEFLERLQDLGHDHGYYTEAIKSVLAFSFGDIIEVQEEIIVYMYLVI